MAGGRIEAARARVTQIALMGLAGTCRPADGERRTVHAGWVPAETGVTGTISFHA